MTGNEATPIPIAVVTGSASSTQEPESGISYAVANTLDGRAETAWNSNGRKDGQGPGLSLTYRFDQPVDLRSITVLNGYQKTIKRNGKPTSDLFTLNSRIRTLQVVTDAGRWTWDLADSRAAQTLTKDLGRTSSVRLEVVAVYSGAKYVDLAVSEVSFSGAVTAASRKG